MTMYSLNISISINLINDRNSSNIKNATADAGVVMRLRMNKQISGNVNFNLRLTASKQLTL